MQQLDLFAAPRGVPVFMPVDPDGPVVRGEVDEALVLPHPRLAWDRARIELHRHTDGRWMWSTSYHHSNGGSCYRVGAKWGRFAASRDDALHFAKDELLSRVARSDDRQARDIIAWAEALA